MKPFGFYLPIIALKAVGPPLEKFLRAFLTTHSVRGAP